MSIKAMDDLAAACERVLLDSMPQALKDALEAVLAIGISPAEVLRRVRRQTGGPRAVRCGLTYLSVECFLRQRKLETA